MLVQDENHAWIHPCHLWLHNRNFHMAAIGDDGSRLTHTRNATSGSSDCALGDFIMKAQVGGRHTLRFTVVQSRGTTGTGMRVGVASEDGTRVCGIRVWDGKLYPSAPHGGDPRYIFLTHRGSGREVEVCVDYDSRRLTFTIDGEGTVDARVTPDSLPDSLRAWVQCVYQGDAIVLSGYRFTPPPKSSKAISTTIQEARATHGCTWLDGARDQDPAPVASLQTAHTSPSVRANEERPPVGASSAAADLRPEHARAAVRLRKEEAASRQHVQRLQQARMAQDERITRSGEDSASRTGPYWRCGESSYPYGALPRRVRPIRASETERGRRGVYAIQEALSSTLETVQEHAGTGTRTGTGGGASESEASRTCRSPASDRAHHPMTVRPWDSAEWLLSEADGDGEYYADRIIRIVAAAIVQPTNNSVLTSAGRSFISALSDQPDRQLAVERLLREGGVIEAIAAEVCEAADNLARGEVRYRAD